MLPCYFLVFFLLGPAFGMCPSSHSQPTKCNAPISNLLVLVWKEVLLLATTYEYYEYCTTVPPPKGECHEPT